MWVELAQTLWCDIEQVTTQIPEVCLHVWCQILDLWLLAEILLGKAPSNNKGVSRRAEKSLVGTQYFFLVMSWRRKFWVLK